jgi:hypothetical protein
MYCVNTSHPEFQTLLDNSNLSKPMLAAQIGVWMDKNGTDIFPTLDELSTIPVTAEQYYNTNPIKQLGMKYNMNTAGFMPPNVNLAQLQNDARKHGLKVVRAQSGSWYLKDSRGKKINPFSYKQLESKSKEAPHQELTDKLLEWATSHGIEVVAMEEMMERFSETGNLYEGAIGLADLLNKLIAIDPSKEKLDTLAEEIAHFATAILKNDASVKRAMKEIVNTEIYKEVKEAYADIYTTEEQFRKEAVDKLLAHTIVSDFQETTKNKGMVAWLKAIIQKFFNKIKKLSPDAKAQIQKDLYPLAQSILNGEYIGEVVTIKDIPSQVFPQKEEIKKETKEITPEKIAEEKTIEFLNRAIKLLEDRQAQLERRIVTGDSKSSEQYKRVTSKLRTEIVALKKDIATKKLDAGVLGYVVLAKKELENIEKALEKMNDSGELDGNMLFLARNFTDVYRSLFSSFNSDMIRVGFPKEIRERMNTTLKSVMSEINTVEENLDALSKKLGVEVLTHSNIDANGEKVDPDYNPEDILDKTQEDVNAWRLGMGNYKFANSGILRAAHARIVKQYNKVKAYAVKTGNTLLAAQELFEKQIIDGKKVKVEDLVEKDENGKPTQYLIRKYAWGEYYRNLNKLKEDIASRLGYDTFSDIEYSTLNTKEKNDYRTSFKKFNDEHAVNTKNEDGTWTNRPKKINSDFAKLMQNEAVKLYYDTLINEKQKSLQKLPVQYRTQHELYKIPGIRKQFVERFFDSPKSFLSNIKESTKESFFIDQDDTQFGEITELNNKMVPIYFTRTFIDPKDISLDLSRSFTIFSEMAENFQEMNKMAGEMEAVLYSLGKRKYIKGRIEKLGIQSREYRALETLIDSTVYNIQKKDATFTFSKKWGKKLEGKTISASKVSSRLASYIRTNNLALNVTTSTAGYLKGTVDSLLEDQLGLYTTVESKNWARGEYGKNIMEVASQVGKKKQTNKMHLLLQLTNVVELNRTLGNSNKSRLTRRIIEKDLLFVNYKTADYAIKGRSALAVLDNHRLYNDKYITRQKFIDLKTKEGVDKKEISKEWKSLRNTSLYNAYEVVDGKLQVKKEFEKHVSDDLLSTVTGKITHITHLIDGTMSQMDKGSISRTLAGEFLLMHRGWFINMIDTRVKRSNINMITGEEEIGMYRASLSFLVEDLIRDKGILAPALAYSKLSPAKKRGVKKSFLDFVYLNIIAMIAAIANLAADEDDDENWTIQYGAYQMNRVLLEQKAGIPWNINELLQIIDEPVVGVRTLKDLTDLTEMFNFEEYERGMYKGKTHAGKWWLKRITPFKNLYELQFPEMKNNFIKQVVDSPTYNLMKLEDDGESLSMMQRLGLLFTDSGNYSDDEVINTIQFFEDEENLNN